MLTVLVAILALPHGAEHSAPYLAIRLLGTETGSEPRVNPERRGRTGQLKRRGSPALSRNEGGSSAGPRTRATLDRALRRDVLVLEN